MAPEFPYKYKKIHPFLHIKEELHWFKTPLRIACMVFSPLLVPIKLFLAALWMGLGSVTAKLLDRFTDGTTILIGFRKFLYHLIQSVFWRLTVYTQLLFVIRWNKKKYNKDAHVIVSNHQNMFDVLIHGFMHHPIYLARSDMLKAYGIGGMLQISRSFSVDKHKSNAQMMESLAETAKDQVIQIFPEGTISACHCVIRARPGAFKLGQLIQPVAIKYYSFMNLAWLCESGVSHIVELSSNIFGFVLYEYLDVIEDETPDQCCKRIADALDVPYLPYTNTDYLYFSGKTDDTSKCSKEYLEDYGWMGQFKDYEKMCRNKKLNPKFQYTKKQLGLE